MNQYIVLLKGINVGGNKRVPMAQLRQLLSDTGFQEVQTYIQSGNVILKAKENDIREIELSISKAILDYFGFEVSVMVKTRENLQRIFDESPFSEDKKKVSYFIMLHDKPAKVLVKEASEKIYKGEEYQIINDCIYYFNENGFGQAKFNVNFFERKFKTFATARNYNTMLKLLSLSSQ